MSSDEIDRLKHARDVWKIGAILGWIFFAGAVGLWLWARANPESARWIGLP